MAPPRTTRRRPAVLVTGATGTTGSRIVARLAALGCDVRAASRRATPQDGARPVRFDWYDPATHAEALRGTDRVHLVPPVGDRDPAAVVLPFLDRARAAGVRRVVLLGSSAIARGGPAVGQVHAVLPELFDEWAVLRPSWFMQNFSGGHAHARSIREDGVIATATGDGRVAFVDADDIAAVAAHALTDRTAPGTDLVITGPEALSYDAVAAVVTRVTGRPVTHLQLTHEQLRDRLATGIPGDFATLLADLDRSIAEGAEDRTTDTVERVTGRPPRGFLTYAQEEMR
ncbi:NAD(P)-dependent oxidoreductase [Streptomyces sp. CB02923]|uniref:NmrA family NAD(P)-binding protein n=1 Tax=Streptomyces sp. CB02923 TaxID=1718985 RepID=UPI0009390C09|nr:NmrA family NAD(P)-binding protein [Streptomyces sp. CB02923]OKI02005.1 NAD(P)-dependent oxidoreductase [Streptomyces sp. CB02923]